MIRRCTRPRDEEGMALVLAVLVMVVVGIICTSMLAMITSGMRDRDTLDKARDREYAADAGVEYAITQVRQLAAPGAGLAPCGPANGYSYVANAVNVRVDCTNAPAVTTKGLLERDVVFTACVDTGVPCTNSTAIIRAQVNFLTSSPASVSIARTYVQSWSVNG